MKRATKIWIGTGVVVLAAGGAAFAVKNKDRNITEVAITKVSRADLVSKVAANGKIEAKRKVDLSANIMGQIVNLAVREGDVVRRGDFLLQIDKAQHAASAAGAQASLKALFSERDAAQANLAEARRVFERARKNSQERIIPVAELDAARAAMEAAQANLAATSGHIDQARANLAGAQDTLSKTTIRAPMNGIISSLPVEEGEVAVIGTMNNPGTKLMTISDMSVVEAVMEVDETDVPNVRIGQKAIITVDAYTNRTFDGVVTEVGSSPIERAGATGGAEAIDFEVKIQITNPPPDIRPGFSSSAEIITGSRPKTVAIPIQALVVREKPGAAAGGAEEEGVYVFDSKEQKVSFSPVKTGITGDIQIEVASGVKEGQEIVSGPFRALRELKDGDKVKLAKEKGKGGEEGDDRE
jgi:HlyD family secretion protein